MIVDYHMHLRDRPGAEPDGRYTLERLEQHVVQAERSGIDEIGITDHAYHFRQTETLWTIPWMLGRCTDDLEEYVAAVETGKDVGLPVKLGIEVDYFPGTEDEIADVLAPYPWDFVLGSVHFVDGLAIDQHPPLVDAVPLEEAWRRYFEVLGDAARSELFDSLPHPDLVKFFGRRPAREAVARLHDQVVDIVAAAGVCVEVSTAGLRKPVGELYPDPEFLRACQVSNVPITLAADAHEPEDVGRDIDRAVALAREAGYETVTVFDERRARQEPLG